MTELFSGEVSVHYGFAHLLTNGPEEEPAMPDVARRGQRNGLAGAAVAHQVHLITGLHTGSVAFTVAWSAAEPPLDEQWQEVVEVSLDVAKTSAALTSFDDWHPLTLPAAGPHRVRYSAARFEAGRQIDTARPGPDRYLLQLWPAPPAPDRIIRQTSAHAAYWHDVAWKN